MKGRESVGKKKGVKKRHRRSMSERLPMVEDPT